MKESCSILEPTTAKNGGTASCRSAVFLWLGGGCERTGTGIWEDGRGRKRKEEDGEDGNGTLRGRNKDFERTKKGLRGRRNKDFEKEKKGNRESCNSKAVFR